jgi:TonB family protein
MPAVICARVLVALAFVGATLSGTFSFAQTQKALTGSLPVLTERVEPALPAPVRGLPRGDTVVLIRTTVSADGSVAAAVPMGLDCLAPTDLGLARTAAVAVKSWRFRATGGGEETIVVGVNWARPANREAVDGPVPTIMSGRRQPRAIFSAPAVHPGTFAPDSRGTSIRAELTIDEAGIPIDAVPIASANPLATAAALDAGLRWRFQPEASVPRRRVQVEIPIVMPASFGPPRWTWPVSVSNCAARRQEAGIVQPRTVREEQPHYPARALKAKEQGPVAVEVLLGENGSVLAGRVTRSLPLLDQAALECVQRWRFTPMLVDGVPKPTAVSIELLFAIK